MSAWEASERFFGLFGTGSEGRVPFGSHDGFLRQHAEEYMDLHSAVELIHVQLNLVHNAPEEVIPLVRRAKDFLDRLKFWIDTPDLSLFIGSRSVDVARTFRRRRSM